MVRYHFPNRLAPKDLILQTADRRIGCWKWHHTMHKPDGTQVWEWKMQDTRPLWEKVTRQTTNRLPFWYSPNGTFAMDGDDALPS